MKIPEHSHHNHPQETTTSHITTYENNMALDTMQDNERYSTSKENDVVYDDILLSVSAFASTTNTQPIPVTPAIDEVR